MPICRYGFIASTGRTATMFIATTLNSLPNVLGLHEGHRPDTCRAPALPLINLQNRKSWLDPAYAESVVTSLRSEKTLKETAGSARVLIDVAYYNSPLLTALNNKHPNSACISVFRRCEDFVRSATIVRGEDKQPAGWPDRLKPLTDRERFISLGRLKPAPEDPFNTQWEHWTAIQRNIWLWHRINTHLYSLTTHIPILRHLYFEDLENDKEKFWTDALSALNICDADNLEQCVRLSTKKILSLIHI